MPEALEQLAGPIDPSNAVPPGPIFQKTDWLSFGVTVLVALVTYLATLAPEVTLEYSGFLSTSANYAGVAHPPGYPVWTIYSWLFVELLPFSNIALRVAIGSAVATALACGLVALMVSGGGALAMQTVAAYAGLSAQEQNLLRSVAGFVAGLGLGLSRSVWSMAVVAETWAVTFLLFSMILFLLTCWVLRPHRRWILYAGFFVFGLLLTSNQELIVITLALLMFVVLGDKAVGRDLSLPVALVSGTGWVLSEFGRFQSFGWLPLVAVMIGGGTTIIVVLQTRQIGLEWKPAIIYASARCCWDLAATFTCRLLP